MKYLSNDESLRVVDAFVEKILIFVVLGGIVAVLLQGIYGLIFSGWSINDVWEGLKFLPKHWVWLFNFVFIVSGWFKVVFWTLTKLNRE